jgi:alpha-tubulin suppressor-like RCC1 family protein
MMLDCSTFTCPTGAVPGEAEGACYCSCNGDAGYESIGDAGACVLNPCLPSDGGGFGPCDPFATCTDLGNGQASCACDTCYTGTGLAGACSKDYCCLRGGPDGGALDGGPCPAPSRCDTQPEGYTCSCPSPLLAYPPGTSDDTVQCIADICDDAGTNPCDQHAVCTNTPDGGTCYCEQGWVGSGLAETCERPNSCDAGFCDINASCAWTPQGGSVCSCDPPYTGPGTPNTCEPPEPCETTPPPCVPDSICTDTQTPPFFTCACEANYQSAAGPDGGLECSPINPCAQNQSLCNSNATCLFTGPGAYACQCNAGFSGDGLVCHNGWQSIATGGATTCATRTDGTLWCWGDGSQGDLANGSINPGGGVAYDRDCAVQVGSSAGWLKVAPGLSHVCAIQSAGGSPTAGTLWCWGLNTNGQLANDTYDVDGGPKFNAPYPLQVGSETDWTDVAAGVSNTCGIKTDGTLWCWGTNRAGNSFNGTVVPPQMGDNFSPPVQMPAPAAGTAWTAVALGNNHLCGMRSDGSLWCWGENTVGQVGDGTTTARTAPVQIGADAGWLSVAAGDDHTCAVRADGTLWCWGDDSAGDIGVGSQTNTPILSPGQVGTNDSAAWTSVACGPEDDHVCATKADGTVWCWGSNTDGDLGVSSSSAYSQYPLQPVFAGLADGGFIAGVAVGQSYAMAIDNASELWCWGADVAGQCGDCSTPFGGPYFTPEQTLH